MVGLSSQTIRFELLALTRLQLFVGLLGEHHDVADPAPREHRVGIDVPDLIPCWDPSPRRREVGLRLAADTDKPEQLDDRSLLISAEDLAHGLSVQRHLLEHQHPGQRVVSISKSEIVTKDLEQPDPDGQGVQHARQQLGRTV